MDNCEERQYVRDMLNDVRAKMDSLSECRYIKHALAEKVEEVEQQIGSVDPKGYFPPLLVFVCKHSLAEIQDLDNDIDLVVKHSSDKRKKAILQFLKSGPKDDRLWVSGLFEIFVKSRFLKKSGVTVQNVQLDYPLPNESDVDVRVEINGKPFCLECTVLTDSDVDREVFEKALAGRIPTSHDLYHMRSRFLYYKIKEKLGQMADDAPNVLLLSLWGLIMLMLPIEWALKALDGGLDKEELEVLGKEALLKALGELLCSSDLKKMGAIFVFEKCLLKKVWVNPNACGAYRMSDAEIAILKCLLGTVPTWCQQ